MTAPIKMILHCPRCHEQHIDEVDEVNNPGWTNPVHTSHRCLKCRTVWRPAEVPTEGVKTLTPGPTDTWKPDMNYGEQIASAVLQGVNRGLTAGELMPPLVEAVAAVTVSTVANSPLTLEGALEILRGQIDVAVVDIVRRREDRDKINASGQPQRPSNPTGGLEPA